MAKLTCDKCGHEADSVPNTTHRRCPGQMAPKGDDRATLPLRPKGDKLPGNQRGTWR